MLLIIIIFWYFYFILALALIISLFKKSDLYVYCLAEPMMADCRCCCAINLVLLLSLSVPNLLVEVGDELLQGVMHCTLTSIFICAIGMMVHLENNVFVLNSSCSYRSCLFLLMHSSMFLLLIVIVLHANNCKY